MRQSLLLLWLTLAAVYATAQVTNQDYISKDERAYNGSYFGLEVSSAVEVRPSIQGQFTHFFNKDNAISAKVGYILRDQPTVTGVLGKVAYQRTIYSPIYIGVGGIYSNSVTTSSIIFRVDNSFLQEVDVAQRQLAYGGTLSLGFNIPLSDRAIIDFSYQIYYMQEHYSAMDGFPTNATFARNRRDERLLRATALGVTEFSRFLNLDLAFIFKL